MCAQIIHLHAHVCACVRVRIGRIGRIVMVRMFTDRTSVFAMSRTPGGGTKPPCYEYLPDGDHATIQGREKNTTAPFFSVHTLDNPVRRVPVLSCFSVCMVLGT